MWQWLNTLHVYLQEKQDKAENMEIVTHFVNDSIEFYKWSLSIAGKVIYVFLIRKVY